MTGVSRRPPAALTPFALVALALLVAASDPVQKDVLIRLIINLLSPSAAGEETAQR